MSLTFTEPPNAEPRALVLTKQLDRLTEQVQTILEQTRVLRERTIATRRQVQESANSRRSGRAATAGLSKQPLSQTIGLLPAGQPDGPASQSPMLALLTKRMREILGLLVQGKSEKEVAAHLGLSPHTVHIHVT